MGGPPAMPGGVEAGQTYCLRWNNHKSNLIEILDALIKVESYVDCTIVVDDKVTFKAHRVVLAANSPYFQAILQDVPMDHCSILFPGVKGYEMRALLEYMYTGEVNVTQSQIPRIMRIAEELEVKGLFDMADLKEKFNKLAEDAHVANPYTQTPTAPYSTGTNLSQETSSEKSRVNGAKDLQDTPPQSQNSSAVISSTYISPTVPASSSSPPYNTFKPAVFPNMSLAETQATTTPTATQTSTPSTAEGGPHGQWPLSPNSAAAAAAMLSSVYESASDMNPLKRKKLSSISSMLMNRDTPILRNVLAQANQTDTPQVMPLLLPGTAAAGTGNGHSSTSASATARNEKTNLDKSNNSFNGSDFSVDKKYSDEPHSPFTDRSFDEDSFEHKGNFTGNFGSSSTNQKPEWKRYKQYTRNDIMSAIQCVRDGMSALQASRKFGVPSRTLYDKVKKLGITTGRPMNRTMKRSPSSLEATAAFPYSHGYGQTEVLIPGIHEGRNGGEERETVKEHHRSVEHTHLPPTMPHPAAALLDHAFLQQALENRGGDIAGREALHAMALAAAAHAAANRMSASPGPNGNPAGRRTPSPAGYSSALKYAGVSRGSEHEQLSVIKHDKERQRLEEEHRREHSMYEEHERDADDEEDQVEDLSVQRRDRENQSPAPQMESSFSPQPSYAANTGVIMSTSALSSAKSTSSGDLRPESRTDEMMQSVDMKRELVIDEGRAD